MNCRYHPTRTAVNTCSQCGDWLCEECTADVGGRIYCASCLQKYWVHDHAAPPGTEAASCCLHHADRPRNVNAFLLLIFSAFSGVNYMYEGLIKRGLLILSSFFLLWYLAIVLSEPIFGIMMAIMIITCTFDAFRIRRRIQAGETVPDSVDDIVGFVKKYKVIILLILAIIIGLHLLGFVVSSTLVVLPGMARGIRTVTHTRWILPLLILLGGIYFIILSGKHSGSKSIKDDSHDNQ